MADIDPVVNLISHIITCVVFLISLAMCKGFIIRGISMSLAEIFIKIDNKEQLEWFCRWFGNGKIVEEYLLEIKSKLKQEKE
jgi:hypothetical protein